MLSKKNIYVALVFIIFLGAFLRFYKLGNNSFVADEFLDINSTYSYFETGKWQNWDFNFGKVNTENVFEARDERAWIYKWQVAEVFRFLPSTEGTARLVSAFWGVFTIFLMYLAGSYFSKKKTVGLLSAFLFAVSISGIEFDRHFRMYAMFFPIYLLLSWFLFKFLEGDYTGKIKFLKSINERSGLNFLFLVPALFFGIISFLTHQLTVNIVAVLAVYLIVWMILNWKKNREITNKYLALIGIGIAGIAGTLIFYPKMVRENFKELTFFSNHSRYFFIFLEDYSHFIVAAIFLVLGIYFLIKKEKLSKEGSWLLVSFLVPLLMAVFIWDRNTGSQYIFFIQSFGIIFIASGIYFAADFFRNNLSKSGAKAYLITILLALLILPNYAYFFQENNTYNQKSDSSNPNYRKVFAYFKKSKTENDVLITRNFRNYYWSGAKVKVFDFGGELSKKKLSLQEIEKIVQENPSGWIIISENDESYISNDVMTYLEKNFEKVSNVQVRGKIKVFRWGNL